jgi:hypothetical protein
MILVVDHYDSFTYNLVQLVESLGHATQVVKSDEEPAEVLVARSPEAVILSPGPGRPEDAGVSWRPFPQERRCSGYASDIRRSASSPAATSIERLPSMGRHHSSSIKAKGS